MACIAGKEFLLVYDFNAEQCLLATTVVTTGAAAQNWVTCLSFTPTDSDIGDRATGFLPQVKVNTAFEEMTWYGKSENLNTFKVETKKMITNDYEVKSCLYPLVSCAGMRALC